MWDPRENSMITRQQCYSEGFGIFNVFQRVAKFISITALSALACVFQCELPHVFAVSFCMYVVCGCMLYVYMYICTSICIQDTYGVNTYIIDIGTSILIP